MTDRTTTGRPNAPDGRRLEAPDPSDDGRWEDAADDQPAGDRGRGREREREREREEEGERRRGCGRGEDGRVVAGGRARRLAVGVLLLAVTIAAAAVVTTAAGDGTTVATLVERAQSQAAATRTVTTAAERVNVIRAGGVALGLGFGVAVGSAASFVSWEG